MLSLILCLFGAVAKLRVLTTCSLFKNVGVLTVLRFGLETLMSDLATSMRGAYGAKAKLVEFVAASKLVHSSVTIMISASCILVLSLFCSAGGRPQREGHKSPRLGKLQGDFGDDEGRHTSARTVLSRRSAGLNEETCTALPGIESALLNNTSTVSHFLHLTLVT